MFKVTAGIKLEGLAYKGSGQPKSQHSHPSRQEVHHHVRTNLRKLFRLHQGKDIEEKNAEWFF